jgi:hypothetical protein
MDIHPLDPDYLDKIRQAHDYAIQEKEAAKARIESAISDIDAIELLAHLSFISQFVPEDNPGVNQSMREHPSQHFLAGLFLKKHEHGTRHPRNDEVEALVEDIDRYFSFFMQDLTLQSFKKDVLKEEDKTKRRPGPRLGPV